MIDAFLSKMRARDEVSAEEEAALRAVLTERRSAAKGDVVVSVNQELTESLLLVEGIACRFKDLRDGSRQILEVNFAGDFVDLHAFLLKKLDHNIGALTDCTFISVRHDDLKRITEELPHLGRMLWLQTVLDAAIHREWVMSLGRRPARSRLSHFFVELNERLKIVGLTQNNGFALPLTQVELAEVTGLTPVHVNRTLKILKELRLVTMRAGKVQIHDLDGLKAEAEFDPCYLNMFKRPR